MENPVSIHMPRLLCSPNRVQPLLSEIVMQTSRTKFVAACWPFCVKALQNPPVPSPAADSVTYTIAVRVEGNPWWLLLPLLDAA